MADSTRSGARSEPAGAADALRSLPVRPGPADAWEPVRRAMRACGTVLVRADVSDWLPSDPDAPGLREMLGGDAVRSRRLTNPQVRSRFIASRLLLKHTAAAVLDVPAETVELAYKPGGRPYLRGLDQVDISLSHTGTLLLAGLSRCGWIGVDAELADRPMLALGTEQQVCTPCELRALRGIAEHRRNAALVRLWTLKEAYSKAIGQGMRFRFTEFGFDPVGPPVHVLRPDGSVGSGDEWSFRTGVLRGRYRVSAALLDAGTGESPDTAVATMFGELPLDRALFE